MAHQCKIAGRVVNLAWTQETSRRFAFRMGEIGGEPTGKQLTNPKTVTTALFKVLWGLLPPIEFARYPDPESLYVAVNDETEGEAIFAAIGEIYKDRVSDAEKKTSSEKSLSPELNSD